MLCTIKNWEDLPYKVTIPLFFLSIIFFFQNKHYLFSSYAVLLLIQVTNKLIDRWIIFKNDLFDWIGSHTLELYVGNTIAAVITHQHIFHIGMNVLTKVSIDIIMTIILSLLLWKANSQLQKL